MTAASKPKPGRYRSCGGRVVDGRIVGLTSVGGPRQQRRRPMSARDRHVDERAVELLCVRCCSVCRTFDANGKRKNGAPPSPPSGDRPSAWAVTDRGDRE